MNKTILQGKWRRMRGNLKTEWGRLTENDRRMLDGKIDQMVGLVQERYGYTQESAAQTLARYLGDYGKRSRKHTDTQAKGWGPALSIVSGATLLAIGWFFFSRFLVASPEAPQQPSAEAEYLANPETELA